jgi:hypothetical protein
MRARSGGRRLDVRGHLASEILDTVNVALSAAGQLGKFSPSSFSDRDLDPLPTLRSGSIDRLDDHHVTAAHFAGHAGG